MRWNATNNITIIPFLDKNNPDEFQKLHAIFLQTDFLLLPTLAECAGVVFSEASAYAIPSITTDTGGVTTYVRNGINGFTIPLQAGAEAYADKISGLISDKETMTRLKLSARKFYEENLDWGRWGLQFQLIAERLLQEKR